MFLRVLTLGLIISLVLFIACGKDNSPIEPDDTTAPAAVDDLSVVSVTGRTVSLSWTSPGDDGDTGTASSYELRRSVAAINPDNWTEAVIVPGLPDPHEAGGTENFTVSGLESASEYYFAILTMDEQDNRSDLSEDVTATTLDIPTVVSVDPPSGSTGIGMVTMFTIEFDRPMDPSTLTTENVTLLSREFSLELEPSLDHRSLFVVPSPNLPPETSIALELSAGIHDPDGLAIEPQSLSYETGPDDCEHWADRFEPDNDFQAAATLGLDALQPALSTCGDDQDTYRFVVDEQMKVTATANFHTILPEQDPGEHLNWYWEWFREDGESYVWSSGSAEIGTPDQFHFSFMPGTYYIQMTSLDDEELILYDLTLESSEPCAEDSYEDNDFPDEAAAVSAGLHENLRACYVDEDWFTLPVTAGQTFIMTVNTGDFTGSKRIHAREPGNAQFTINDYGTNSIADTLEITADGDLECYFQAWGDDVVYDMMLELN